MVASVPDTAFAQTGRSTGVGIQLGSPSGITVKIMRPRQPHLDFLGAWDLDNFLYLTGNAVWERRVEEGVDADLRMFYGIGAFIGFRDNRRDDVVLGPGGTVGASLWLDVVELFIQLTPTFEIAPRTDFGLGGGIGARYHFANS